MLRNLESANNPWGLAQASRADWAEGLGVRVIEEGERAPEYLYWVGCAGSFDDRAKEISRSVVRLLDRAGVSFAILGPRELCTGDPAWRIGNEYLFQTLAEQNVETLAGAEVTTVIANCPHCFNTPRNEYPDYGGASRSSTTRSCSRVSSPRAAAPGRPAPGDDRLSRPVPPRPPQRRVPRPAPCSLASIPGVETVEMPRHGERALCCGAGGARMWMEERIGKRINQERVEEAASTGADTIAVSCPYCLIMLDDGARARTDVGRVEDLAQVLDRSAGAP